MFGFTAANMVQDLQIAAIAAEEIRRSDRIKKRRQARSLMRESSNALEFLPEREFLKTFRLGKEAVRDLASELRPYMPQEKRSDSISVLMKLLITLAFYATGSYQTLVGQSALHNVSQTSVSRAVRQITDALNQKEIFNKYVKWPQERQERQAIKAKFYRKFKIPGVLGCIDGTHVAILRPILHEERYYNRKGYHSLNVMILLITLAFYATGSYQTLVGQSALHNVSQTSVSRAVRQITDALNQKEIFNKYVKWPQERQERQAIKAKFYRKFKIPGVLGCIDGTHVAILRPILHEERYYNRKGYHSLNVMIICDSDLNILCVDPSTPGQAHDASVWQNHPLNQHLKELARNGEDHCFLLGDSGYALRKTMLTPILNTVEGTPEHHFYNLHVTARNSVERCIGVLKARFRCLLAARALHYSPITAGKIVNACSVLHNIANSCNTEVPVLSAEEEAAENLRQIQNQEELQEAAAAVFAEEAPRNRRVNEELQEGRAFQRALVEKLWAERN